MGLIIESVSYYLPKKVITNNYLAEQCNIDTNFLEEKVGIKERRVSLNNESTSDLAVGAADILFNNIINYD